MKTGKQKKILYIFNFSDNYQIQGRPNRGRKWIAGFPSLSVTYTFATKGRAYKDRSAEDEEIDDEGV